jgi:hypothetical protein
MRFIAASFLSAVILSGCGTIAFTPTEYSLRDGAIPTFDVAGAVAISNAQPSADPVVVYSYMGTKLSSDLKAITEVMVQQASKELQKNGHPAGGKASKSMSLKVNSLLSEYTNAFFWKSNIQFQATLGDGQVINLTVPHKSGVLQQDLNGCIAEGVMVLFKDARVKAYLAS